jgi:hypothetical protein
LKRERASRARALVGATRTSVAGPGAGA